MASRPNKYLIVFTLVAFALLLTLAGFYIFKKNLINDFFAQNLPDVSQMGTINLPGKLLGPEKDNRSANLDQTKIINWTNYYRREANLSELTSNKILARAAQNKVEDMFQQQYFEHVSPDGTSPDQLVLAAGYNYKTTGENLALGDFKDEKDLVDAWMASPGHRANILNPDYTEIGVASGLAEFEDRGITWLSVQEFGAPAPQCTQPDQSLTEEIEAKKAEYDELKLEYDSLIAGNKKLTKTEYNEAKALQDKLNNLYDEINELVNLYNTQVDSYNICIKQ